MYEPRPGRTSTPRSAALTRAPRSAAGPMPPPRPRSGPSPPGPPRWPCRAGRSCPPRGPSGGVPSTAMLHQVGDHRVGDPGRRCARHSSTTSTAPQAAACCAHRLDGQRGEPAQVQHARRDAVLVPQPLGRLQAEPQAVGVADDQQVAGIGLVHADLAGEQRLGRRGVGRSASRRRHRCAGPSRGTARSAPGRRRPGRPRSPSPRRRAACAPRRRRGPAPPSPGRGCRAVLRCCCRCGSGRRSPSGRRGRRPAPPSGCGTGRC